MGGWQRLPLAVRWKRLRQTKVDNYLTLSYNRRMIIPAGWMTYEQAAERLDLSFNTIRKYAADKWLVRDHCGNTPLVSIESVEASARNRNEPGNPNFVASAVAAG